jgi:hypothetical protein
MARIIHAAFLAASLLLSASPPAVSGERNRPDSVAQGADDIAAPSTVPATRPFPAPEPNVRRTIARPTAPAVTVSADDIARFLAGMQPSAASPLAALTRDQGWLQHARFFDRAFGALDQTQLAKIRAWSDTQLRTRRPAMFYMFSGPDFLYADAFFPAASTYVLAGLESVGQIPEPMNMPRAAIGPALGNIAASLHTVLNFSFFKTHNMRMELNSGRLGGTVPILYVFLARAGKTIRDAGLVTLDQDGVEQPDGPGVKSMAHGVRIVFTGQDGRVQTLYYFSTNLANDGVASSGILKFCERLGAGDSLIKSASYLLHSGKFSKIRDFLLAHSASILQDDSGIPVRDFDRQKWQLQPFGQYRGPVDVFPQNYQPRLRELFQNATPMDFGVGYRWRPRESNLLLAVRKDATAGGATATP